MTGLSLGAAAALAEKFPWDRYHTVIDVGAAERRHRFQRQLRRITCRTRLDGRGHQVTQPGPRPAGPGLPGVGSGRSAAASAADKRSFERTRVRGTAQEAIIGDPDDLGVAEGLVSRRALGDLVAPL